MKTNLKVLAQNLDNEIVEFTGLYAQAHMQRDAAYRARVRNEAEIERLSNRVNDLRKVLGKLEDVYSLYHWNRAWIVPGGHVHRSRGCHTLYADTVIYPVPECSALTEPEIVELAADRACTVCYPSAPVDKKSTLMAPGEAEQAKAQADRKAEREAKLSAKEAKKVKVVLPKGEYGTSDRPYTKVFGTVTSARTEAMDMIWWALFAMDNEPSPAHALDKMANFDAVVKAIAGHRDSAYANVDELVADLTERVGKKYIKDLRTDSAGSKGLPRDEAVARYNTAKERLDALLKDS